MQGVKILLGSKINKKNHIIKVNERDILCSNSGGSRGDSGGLIEPLSPTHFKYPMKMK